MKLQYKTRQKESSSVWSLYFDHKDAKWKPGQSILLAIPKPTWGTEEHRMTIASSPSEKQIRLTTDSTDSYFKELLLYLRPGQEIEAGKIDGNFVWKGNSDKLMIAESSGIIPYRSMLKSRSDSGKPINSTLIYINRGTHLFQDDFITMTGQDSTFRVILLNKRLTMDKKSTLPPKWIKSQIYISGTDQTVQTLKSQFIDRGVPLSRIKTNVIFGH